jgi:arginyl-tRNA synthetase
MKELIAKILKKEISMDEKEILGMIEIPPSSELGDYSFPCFGLSKIYKKNPNQICRELNQKLKKKILPKEIEKTETAGAYLNFFVNKKIFCSEIVKEVLSKKDSFGKKKCNLKGIMEFSQANTHKAFHVGHIRGTSLGESLARTAEFFGEKVIRVNYQGDTGMHVAKWIWCCQKYHSGEKLRNDESWIASIYVDAVKRLNQNPKLQDEVNDINRKLEERKDKKLLELWKKTRKLSLDSMEKIYKELNTKFNKYYFESEFEKKGKKIAEELLKKGIAEKSEGAVIMNLEKYALGIWVLLRKDGTVLYSSKDLALAIEKFKNFSPDWSVYVHGSEQNLHFRQLIKTLELMKFKDVKKIHPISFDLVRLPTGKMSSRTGDNILYSDFMKEIKDYAKKRIKDRAEKISINELEHRSEKISIAAIKYSMLKQDPKKVIIFDKKEALSFEGDTGPYLLYSYARASSIIKKSKITASSAFKISDIEKKEAELCKKISLFPEIVLSSYKNFNPSIIANYSYQLAKIFSEFYHECPVINSENEKFRISLVESFRVILKNSLNLLGINVIEEM